MYFKLLFSVYLLTENVICKTTVYNIAVLLENTDYEIYDSYKNIFGYAFADVNLSNDKFILDPLMVSVTPDDPFPTLNSTCNVLTKGIIGIFGFTSSSNTQIIQSMCDAMEIPLVLTHWTESLESGTYINLYPQTNQLSTAYLEIISFYNWKEFTLLYVNAQSLLKLGQFIESAKSAGIVLYIVNIDPDGTGNYRPVLRELRKTTQTYFVLDCDLEVLYNVLNQIQQMGMLASKYNYFLTNLDFHTEDLGAFLNSGADITGIQLINPKSSKMEHLESELYYNSSSFTVKEGWKLDTETALVIDAVHIFSNALKLLNVQQDSNLNCNNSNSWKDGLSVVNELKASFYSGLTGDIKFDEQRSTFELTIFKLDSNGITQTGSWSTTTGINIHTYLQEEEVEGTDIKKNTHFVVVINLAEPYSMVKESSETLLGNDRFEGFAIDLIHEMSKIQGFNYTFVTSLGNGRYDPANNKWYGMIGDVIDGKADLAISDLTITYERETVVDFTHPFMEVGIGILYQIPSRASPGLFYFARPFASDFWRAIAIASVCVMMSLYIVGRLSQSEWQKVNSKSKYVVNQLTLSNSAWLITGGLFRQNTQVKIRSVPARIIAAAWWLFCFILIAMYIASLISHTVFEEYETDFIDVESLVANAYDRGIRYGALRGGATEAFFRDSQSPLFQEIYQHMDMNPKDMASLSSEGVHRAESSNYAFFMESSTIEYVTNRICNLQMYGNILNERAYGIAMRKGSPYLSELSGTILKLRTSGKIAELKKKWWENRRGGNMCEAHSTEDVGPVSLGNISGLMYITIFGIVIAIFCGTLEFFLHTYKLSRRLNTAFLKVLRCEIKRCFSAKTKPTIDPTLLSKPSPEDENNAACETVELS